MLTRLLLCLCLIALVSQAKAGAWPRQKGSGFASVSVQLSWPQNIQHWIDTQPTDQYRTAYLEYGLTDKLTIGLDIGNSVSGASKSIAFLQYPIRNREKGPKIAFQLGIGQISGERVVRPGLSLGWGLKKGWLSMDSFMETRTGDGVSDYKLDITWGRNLARDRKLLLQLQTGIQHGDPAFARFAPSLVTPLGKRLKMETGATWGLTGDSSMGVKFGLWTDF
ncbi:hypothetical protein J7443_10935 [Tropicibacter sp. R15_0]|uniref:hypothetical protein n=1 Tax=Tropicibacter sp. R15_0 TaxID=2821101 RepID=UPI001AD9CCD8|nr:hypothetical protein [Tropicibacter sp. R15_0]MBO9465745.1 hypothetical protein [Tropicibacter sp. R15_0]